MLFNFIYYQYSGEKWEEIYMKAIKKPIIK